MQVAHQKDHVTHAVIGGGDTIDFGISSSAEFFNILSSTLYKDQILAVVREVLCNAWDAHIEAGKTHIPVEITLTHEKFTIKDVGTGIHRDDMGQIYGTYGNSTKKNDGKQTGGFGLGCKAPFAYTDHFEVISCHDGVKTIYNLSKSSAQAMGKPGIVPIASFPTSDTGLQVSIGIISPTDYQRFFTLIKRIAANGDMNMTLNGTALNTLGFDTTKSNYLVTRVEGILDNQTPIMVRYGNVVYPVDSNEETQKMYSEIYQHLESLTSHSHRPYRIIFQAPPHSISVTPSRESLSMQEHTVKTLKSLFKGFLATLQKGFSPACDQYAITVVQQAVADGCISKLLSRERVLPGSKKDEDIVSITDLDTMAQRYMQSNYPQTTEFRKKDVSWRLNAMVAAGLLDRGLVQTFLRETDSVEAPHAAPKHHYGHKEHTDWLQRRIIRPLLVKMAAAGVDHSKLFVYDQVDNRCPNAYTNTPPLVRATSASLPHLFSALPYLRKIVVVSSSRTDIKHRAYRHEVFQELGNYDGFLFYHASMKKTEREAALAFFEASGMQVVDLTVKQEWELAFAARNPVVAAPRKPAKVGLVALKSVRNKSNGKVATQLSRDAAALRITAPEFLVPVSIRKDEENDTLKGWDAQATSYIVDLFGEVGGITNNSAVHDKWLKQGVMDFEPYILGKLCAFMLSNPRVQEYWAFNPNRVMSQVGIYKQHTRELVKMVYASPQLRATFGQVNNLTEDEQKMVYLWEHLNSTHHHALVGDHAKAHNQLLAIPVDPANLALVDKFRNSPLLHAIYEQGLVSLIKNHPDQINNINQILAIVLNP